MFKYHNWKKKVAVGLSTAVATVGVMTASVFASTTTDFTSITNALTTKLTVAEVGALIAAMITAGIGFMLLWFGARKLTKAIIVAFKTGKIHF